MKLKLHLGLLFLALLPSTRSAETFRIATYNLENYLDQPTETRPHVKEVGARAKIRDSIRVIKPDVIALEEMGGTNALLELRASLKAKRLNYPFWEHVTGVDTNIHLAVLSKFPILTRHPHTNESFLLDGKRFQVSRGFAEVEIQAAPDFTFSLIVAHLKSRRPVAQADEAELRLQEAKILRGIVDAHFTNNPNARLVILGDLNDVKNSASTKEIIGRGKFKLTDTRPAERNGDDAPNPNPRYDPMNITWTYYYGLTDEYSRIDYILLSPAMKRHWLPNETFIPKVANWGVGSDHRPIVAGFATDSH